MSDVAYMSELWLSIGRSWKGGWALVHVGHIKGLIRILHVGGIRQGHGFHLDRLKILPWSIVPLNPRP